MKKYLLSLLCGVLTVLASILAYLSVCFTASQPENQPENYTGIRYKAYEWICIAAFFAGILLSLWSLVRAVSEPRARTEGKGKDPAVRG